MLACACTWPCYYVPYVAPRLQGQGAKFGRPPDVQTALFGDNNTDDDLCSGRSRRRNTYGRQLDVTVDVHWTSICGRPQSAEKEPVSGPRTSALNFRQSGTGLRGWAKERDTYMVGRGSGVSRPGRLVALEDDHAVP